MNTVQQHRLNEPYFCALPQRGFTLIEVLVVMSLIGVLALLSVQSFQTYRKKASYTVAMSALREARGAATGTLIQADIVFPEVNFVSQSTSGELTDADMSEVFPGVILSPSIKFTGAYFPNCGDANCTAVFAQVRPCSGEEYATWTRLGDGTEILAEHIAGVGCP